jgi:two-component system, NtrC family, sensor kinase
MVDSSIPEYCLILNVALVAEGEKCLSVIRELYAIKRSRLRIKLVAIAPTTKSVSCDEFADKIGIQVFGHYRDLYSLGHLDMILELTGNNTILDDISNSKPATIGVLDQKSSLLLLNIANLYNQIGHEGPPGITEVTSFAATLLEASPDGVLVIDRNYRIINSNNSYLVTGDLERKDIIGKYCYQAMNKSLTPCSDRDACCSVLETIKTGKPARRVREWHLSDGNTLICQITSYPIFNRYSEIVQFVIVVRDMTQELKERVLEETESIKKDLTRAIKEDRLSSLGRLVASVCHEINNPITSIVTFTKLVLTYLKEIDLPDKTPDLVRYLELSFREALRCGGIVKNLLTFARQNSIEATCIDIAEMISTVLQLTSHQLELANVVYTVDLPALPFTAWGDYGQIQQCLLNLIFNAIDAMPNGGSLLIKGKEDETEGFICFEVTDIGHGINPEDLQRIFEPFFTTKTAGKGVGLGLAMVYGIIKEHQGTVEVESTQGEGTTFRVKLPKTAILEKGVTV